MVKRLFRGLGWQVGLPIRRLVRLNDRGSGRDRGDGRAEGFGAESWFRRDTSGAEREGWMRSWLRDMVVSVVVSAFIIIFLYQPVRVEGTSMLPMLEDQDRLVHQQDGVQDRGDPSRRCGGLSLSARPYEELYQASDCAARRRSADRPWAGVCERARDSGEVCAGAV